MNLNEIAELQLEKSSTSSSFNISRYMEVINIHQDSKDGRSYDSLWSILTRSKYETLSFLIFSHMVIVRILTIRNERFMVISQQIMEILRYRTKSKYKFMTRTLVIE